MRFLNPAGLWLLLGIPVLILIYLIKAQHEDRPVSSTFIWKLSNKFMKKRMPIQRFRKILLFIMQLLMIIAAAFMVARPAIINGESCEYIAIVDASASMQIADEEGVTRFERALEQVETLTENINQGHKLSVILASDSASYLVQSATSVNEVKVALKEAECALGSCDIEEALETAQLLCNESANAEVIFFTDCEYAEMIDISVVNLNQNEWNVSVESMNSVKEKENTTFTANLISYNQDATVSVGLRIDGQAVDAKQIELFANTTTEVSFTAEGVASYDTAEIYVQEQDGLENDNSYCLCRNMERTYKVLLVSESPLYLESALKALGTCEVTTATSFDDLELNGYELYIFDQITPETYPEDGSVIVFGTEGLPDGVSVKTVIEKEATLTKVADVQSDLYKNLSLTDSVVSKYGELVANAGWETLLTSENASVLVSTKLSNQLTISVLSFDLHDSNLPMQISFLTLMDNLVEYSVPALLKETDFSVGESVTLTVMPLAEEIYVELPDASIKELSTDGATCTVATPKTGVYTAVMTIPDGGEYVDFFVHVPNGEVSVLTGGTLELNVNRTEESADAEDALTEIWFWMAVALLVLLLAEWGCYYHEQY